MAIHQVFDSVPEYSCLRADIDTANRTRWLFMHCRRIAATPGYRACFSPPLMREMHNFFNRAGDSLRPIHNAPDGGIEHGVIASDAEVFNLGGDLDLFSRLIRQRNRTDLASYAHACIDAIYEWYRLSHESNLHTIALIQGDALGGGLECALSCRTIIAESGVGMGFPEVIFGLFPGMGAFSFLRHRISPRLAEDLMLSGNMYSSDEMHKMGVVDVLVPKGEGIQATRDLIRRNQRIPHARLALNRVQHICAPVTHSEMLRVTDLWVDTALQLGDKSLRMMERLVRAQQRQAASSVASNVTTLSRVG
ncbi:MAG: crotonase/enoyl-CoA hydratase family protein [Dokdonella sp.]